MDLYAEIMSSLGISRREAKKKVYQYLYKARVVDPKTQMRKLIELKARADRRRNERCILQNRMY